MLNFVSNHHGNSKCTTWDSSQLANNNPTMPHQRQCQKSSPDLVLFSIFSDRASSTGIWITLYQIHYLRSIDIYIFTRMTIPTTWLKSNIWPSDCEANALSTASPRKLIARACSLQSALDRRKKYEVQC